MISCTKTPTVSVGLPTYNGQTFIERTLDSLLSQTFRDFELVISDNGSDDDTQRICRAYAERDPRITYIRHEQNRGAAWNYNYVFSASKGKYFKWAADDDVCLDAYLDECVRALDATPEAVLAFTHTPHINLQDEVVGNAELGFDVDCTRPHVRFRHLICHGHDCRPVFGLIRSDVLRLTRLIASYVGSDRGLIAELALHGPFVEIKRDLQYRRIHPRGTERSYQGRLAERLTWFDARRAGRRSLREWSLFRAYVASAVRAPISAKERILCLKELLRWLRWGHGKTMLREFKLPFAGAPSYESTAPSQPS